MFLLKNKKNYLWIIFITPSYLELWFTCYLGDRYDEQPSSKNTSQLDEIDDWNDGKKSVVNEAVDKVKDLWNKAHGRKGIDEDSYRYNHVPAKVGFRG